jgi:hypothetical protein
VRRDAAAAMGRLRPSAGTHTAFRRSGRLRKDAGLDWPGFRESDFGDVTGTTWRRRDDPRALEPLFLRPLLQVDSDMTTYPIYAVPEVHFAARDRYEQGANAGRDGVPRSSSCTRMAPGTACPRMSPSATTPRRGRDRQVRSDRPGALGLASVPRGPRGSRPSGAACARI